jgi:FkbM family methyltransferase
MQHAQTQLHRISHGIIRRCLRLRPFGKVFSALANAAGFSAVSRLSSKHSGYVPNRVTFDVLSADNKTRAASMFSADGNDHIVRDIWVHGLADYEAPLPQVYIHLARGAKTVLDVGANSGLYAILAAVAEPSANVISFEPFPPAEHWLTKNLKLNRLTDRVKIVPAAVGASPGTAELYIPAKKFGETLETSASLDKNFRSQHSQILKVQTLTLDDYIKTANVDRVSILRADVEGVEHLVLAGATEILKTHRPLVFVEVLSTAAADRLEPFRAQANYIAISLEPTKFIELPKVQWSPSSSNQLWYPQERRHELFNLAGELKLIPVTLD